jgi:hypothetical protein
MGPLQFRAASAPYLFANAESASRNYTTRALLLVAVTAPRRKRPEVPAGLPNSASVALLQLREHSRKSPAECIGKPMTKLAFNAKR